jgi:hypothetical protein
MFICVDRQMGPPQWSDLGMYLQTVMLSLQKGLHLPQRPGRLARGSDLVSSLPAELMLFCGLRSATAMNADQPPANRPRRAEGSSAAGLTEVEI